MPSHKGRVVDPRDHMGVYRCVSDVPEKDRLSAFIPAYDGRDMWAEYVAEAVAPEGRSDEYLKKIARVGDRWRAFMADRATAHHALASPADADAWAAVLLDEFSLRSAHEHWMHVCRFYTWLLTHADHPHLYQPFWIAAATLPNAARAWCGERVDEARFTLPDGRGDDAETEPRSLAAAGGDQ